MRTKEWSASLIGSSEAVRVRLSIFAQEAHRQKAGCLSFFLVDLTTEPDHPVWMKSDARRAVDPVSLQP